MYISNIIIIMAVPWIYSDEESVNKNIKHYPIQGGKTVVRILSI